MFGNRVVVSDPAGVRRIFLDNVANYRKDDLQLRVLRPGLGNSLLTADGEEWRTQRRSLAPLFTPRQVTAFADAMSEATREGVERLRQSDGRRIDLSDEMARLTLEILEHTLFSSGLSRDPGEFQRAVLLVNVAYFFDSNGQDIAEIYRVLRLGGRTVIYVTSRETMSKWPFAGPQTHRIYDRNELLDLLESAGFQRSDIKIEELKLPLGIKGLLAIATKSRSHCRIGVAQSLNANRASLK